jgi:hypothetical protein
MTSLDASESNQEPPRYSRMNLYQRFLDWLWFGPLTRDLHRRRRRHPSQFSVLFSLLGDICRDSWSAIMLRLGRSRRRGT